ncbi:glycine betaine/L-proline ABC transporter ATP-binding protein [Aurantimonas sp. C2-6-R+9]|uniref:quaternary amine ABC transporter ATP-binding protein n=1 Tax=unclassified Aurantimonas TaxID=2638230 RepID=UPI002E170CFF|nr:MULTISPECIES: glycine betaine/L-proline ABC transporter ATP-binding protein [unclassified Aurantimonas]MEC5293444.1 glycine betaine/L-proline ABC transporter ATP-binding protein [Aurantimonas sp. C2-3-R2]MEC5383609.1 glycine betaine/L-proline ABC transporter ATP-binding protein [Aurantimonas sp. C2-6-R+9]MEC5414532.1 glycine betaine/L-proline ABC transporter ATP-binding protein [Aurantimonas sp. C2-4-R8]
MTAKIAITSLYKIFGDRPDAALDMLRRGEGKEAILESTGATVAVQDATFEVAEGEIFVVMGLSGSGKSTLVRLLNGLIPPTSGQIIIDGQDVAQAKGEALRTIRRNTITMVFQHFALFPHWSVADNVAYGLKVKGMAPEERRERALAVLEQVGLVAWADSLPGDLSGGMQQRVGLARGLASDPQVLLMDEPFGALDPLIRREMQDELLELQKKLKKTIVFITHDLNEAMLLGDTIAIMKDGLFVQVGTAQDIVSNPADDYVQAFVADIDRGRVFTAGDVSTAPVTAQLHTDSAEVALRRMEESQLDALYVLDGDTVSGVVTHRDVSAALRRDSPGDAALGASLITDFTAVNQDTFLHELYGPAGTGLPIAVTGDDDRLLGVVETQAVLAQLDNDIPAPPDYDAPDTTGDANPAKEAAQ